MAKYILIFFKDGRQLGAPVPEQRALDAVKSFAEWSLMKNGADSYAIYEDGKKQAVHVRRLKKA